jgi:Glyoxalase-like domain
VAGAGRVADQRTDDEKVSKERMHLDLETDDVEAEVQRLEALGATRYDHQQERGFDFWVLRDPWGNEFCVLHPNYPRAARPTPALDHLVVAPHLA